MGDQGSATGGALVHGTTDLAIIMPALNEEEAIGEVLRHLPVPAAAVTVVDNGSTDATAERAEAAGARVVREPRRGYGRACLAGLRATRDAETVVFLDADFSDDPADLVRLLAPIERGEADFVLGARPPGSRPWHARLGTALCVALINRLWGCRYTDLGPFRAIRRNALDRLGMMDQTWGWTIEMQVKAAEAGLRCLEIPVSYRDRIGQSKISGTLTGTVRAGGRMLAIVAMLWWTRRRRRYAA
jgi:glycosyltransferase involved in cell wall biosynthesis